MMVLLFLINLGLSSRLILKSVLRFDSRVDERIGYVYDQGDDAEQKGHEQYASHDQRYVFGTNGKQGQCSDAAHAEYGFCDD